MKSKAAVKVEVKSEVGSPQPETSILKRLDGRPMLICKIPYSSIRSIKKRERKSSASLAAGSDSSQSGSKKAKRSKVTSVEVDVKPDATDLVDLPGYNKSARNLMPPPENKVEAEAAENYATPNQVYEDPSANQVKDEFQVIFFLYFISSKFVGFFTVSSFSTFILREICKKKNSAKKFVKIQRFSTVWLQTISF